MNKTKSEVRAACKKAYSYAYTTNKVGLVTIKLFDKYNNCFFMFDYNTNFEVKEKNWIRNILFSIDERIKSTK